MSTWVVKYGLPRWAVSYLGEASFVNVDSDLHQSAIITSHVAVGSLILVASLAIALRLGRRGGAGWFGISTVSMITAEAAR
jgi:hypothetical protein